MLWTNGLKTEIFELKFLIWLISAMQANYVHIKDEQLARKFECSRQRIGRLKQKLKKDNLLKYEPGVIFLNPEYIWRGNAYQRELAAEKYYKFGKDF